MGSRTAKPLSIQTKLPFKAIPHKKEKKEKEIIIIMSIKIKSNTDHKEGNPLTYGLLQIWPIKKRGKR